jgi:flagellin
MSSGEFYESLRNAAEEAGCTLDGSAADGAVSVLSAFYGSSEEINIEVTEALAKQLGVDQLETAEQDEKGTYSATLSGENAKVGFPDEDPAAAGFTTTATVRAEGNRITVSDQHGFSIDFLLDKNYTEADTADGDGVFTLEVTDIGSMTIQIGGNQYQTMDIRIPEVSSESYYLDTIDVTIYGGPERAMLTLDDAIAELNETRSRIGAFQNRLEYATSSLAETNEDMTSAYSTLLDTDMAEEMSEYTQQSVLQQAAVSVLSQANDLPQTVLSLLQ